MRGFWPSCSPSPTDFEVVKLSLGRVALKSSAGVLSIGGDGVARLVRGRPGQDETFQWIETPTGEVVLLSLRTHRFLRLDPANSRVIADSPGPLPEGSDGTRFGWRRAP